ncbi:MAG: YceI family protein [Candidatus Thermoplasmatota archaeon]|nr:YceI family protein [Candidatus Thermoplasmatota archaeon]
MQSTMTWKQDLAHSSAEFSIRHMMISNVKGKFKVFEVNFEGDTDDFEHSIVKVRIDPQSIDTGEEKRDAHLRSPDFFSTETNKDIYFESTSIKKISDGEYEIHGSLNIRGIKKAITLKGTFEGRIKDPYGFERFGATVTGEIVREDFGLKWNSVLETGGVMVGSKVKFEVHVEMVLQANGTSK